VVNINPLLTPAIQAYLIALIYRNTRTNCSSLAALCPFVSHDSFNRLLHSSLPWSRRLRELFSSRMFHAGGYLLLDDTTWQRRANRAEAVSKVWSSTAGSVRLGMQVVLLVWADGHRKIPVGMRLWQKGGKSKVELAKELIREAADARNTCYLTAGTRQKVFRIWFRSWAGSMWPEPKAIVRRMVNGFAGSGGRGSGKEKATSSK
jgi:hypothetical protein